MRIRLHASLSFLTAGVFVSIHHRWNGCGLDPCDGTYRYAGVCWMRVAPGWRHLLWARFGYHVDDFGRLYVYLGRISLWQDIRPFKRQWNRDPIYKRIRKLGPLEFVFG